MEKIYGKVRFEFRVERVGMMDINSGDEGRDVIDDCDEKSEKKNDQDEVDGMRQEVYSKGKEMHNERNDL